jgi:hypothetical protein
MSKVRIFLEFLAIFLKCYLRRRWDDTRLFIPVRFLVLGEIYDLNVLSTIYLIAQDEGVITVFLGKLHEKLLDVYLLVGEDFSFYSLGAVFKASLPVS